MKEETAQVEDGEQQILPDGDWEVIGFIGEINEKDWEKVVEPDYETDTVEMSAFVFMWKLGIRPDVPINDKWCLLVNSQI